MLTTLIVPKINPPSASVPASTSASNVSSQSIGFQRRCASQNNAAMISDVPPTDVVTSRSMPPAISATKAGRPVYPRAMPPEDCFAGGIASFTARLTAWSQCAHSR